METERTLIVGRLLRLSLGIFLAFLIFQLIGKWGTTGVIQTAEGFAIVAAIYVGIYWAVLKREPSPTVRKLLTALPLALLILLGGNAWVEGVFAFFALSLFVAAANGHPGCEVTAIQSAIWKREARLTCILFGSFDSLERRMVARQKRE